MASHLLELPAKHLGQDDETLVKELGDQDKVKLLVKLLDFGLDHFVILHGDSGKTKVPQLLVLDNAVERMRGEVKVTFPIIAVLLRGTLAAA